MTQALSHVSEDKTCRVVAEDTEIVWTCEGETYRLTVPEGYRYRPGLTPKVGLLTLLRLVGPSYALENASAAHDRLFDLREQGKTDVSRAAADAVMLADDDDPRWLRYAAWGFLRLTSWIVW